ncbi:hypothetical protein [Streptomyces massasporeus]|uniref:hypothetical protein n=1 Tax=Streptomyces massasporeus TaxID=67324 RepID=UPI00167255BC|nr:hypothetical protein [Streptomyces massasporeus]
MGSSHPSAVVQVDDRQRDVLRWYASLSSATATDRTWPEGAVVVLRSDLLPDEDDLAPLGCRTVTEVCAEDLRRGAAERSIPASARYVLVVVAREEFDLGLARDIVAFGRRVGMPVGTLPARSRGELGFMLRRMALARRAQAGRHVVVDAADSSSVVGDAAQFTGPGAQGVHSLSVYGHGNESHVKIGGRFICSHSLSRFPEQDCACAAHDLRLCRLDEIRCVWIHLGSCGALIPDWRRSVPASNFVDAFASSYAATVCGSLYRMPTSRAAIVAHELNRLAGSAPGGDDPSAGTLCLGDPVLLGYTDAVLDRQAVVTGLQAELDAVASRSAHRSRDQERVRELTRTLHDVREQVTALRLAGGPAARGALDDGGGWIDSASGWSARAARVLSAANERQLYDETARAEVARCLAKTTDLARRFEQDLVRFVASVPAIGGRDVERAMKSGLLFGPKLPEELCACRLCGLPVYVSTARNVASDRQNFWAQCDVCGHLARSPDPVRFPLITVPAPGVVGVRFFGGRRTDPAARVVVDIDDGVGTLHTRTVHEIAAGEEARVRCDPSGSGPSLRMRALVVSGFAMWFARATVPLAQLLGPPP